LGARADPKGLQISDFGFIKIRMFDQPKSENRMRRASARVRQSFLSIVNVKKIIVLLSFGILAVTSAACSSGDAAPTRTRVAQAEATQTPWIIYIPVTTTPGPATATLEPTSTPNAPQPTPVPATRTRAPATARPATTKPPTAPSESPTTEPPTATQAPSCGQTYQVKNLTFPEDHALREAKAGSGAGKTIQFKWDPIASYELDPKIGYRVIVSSPSNSQALYISHNTYLKDPVAILSQQATYGLTQGDDTTATWHVDVIMTTGEFNDSGDDTTPPTGSVIVCGPSSPTFTIELTVK
jgi:hypothetical protein